MLVGQFRIELSLQFLQRLSFILSPRHGDSPGFTVRCPGLDQALDLVIVDVV